MTDFVVRIENKIHYLHRKRAFFGEFPFEKDLNSVRHIKD